MRQKGSAASRCSAVAWIPKATEAFGIKNLAPAQDVDLPLPYPQLEHLVGEDRGLDDGDPRSDLLVRYRRQEYRSHIKRVSDASERLLANSPYGEKAHRKKTAEKPRLI